MNQPEQTESAAPDAPDPSPSVLSDGDEATDQSDGWSSLWDSFARGVRNNTAGEVVVQAVRIGGLIVLARALRPADFGLLKVLTVVSIFGILLAEAGIPEALIQRADLRPEHEVTAWWSTVVIGSGLAAGLYFAAPWLAMIMGTKGLVFGSRLLCVPLLLHGISVCARARLYRELRFGAIAVANVLAEVLFLAVALVLLFEGLPQWSLPAALAARVGTHALVVIAADGRLRLGLPRLRAALDLTSFGGTALAGGLITSGSDNIDYLLVGRLLGDTALGYYSIAWDLFRFIPGLLHRIAGLVAFPAFCQLQENDDELARAYRTFVNYIGRAFLPVIGCITVAAPEVLASVYGAKWLPAAMPMRVLAFGLVLVGMRSAIGTVYYAKGYPSFDIYLNGVRLLLIAAAVGLTAQMGLIAICAGVGLVEAAISIVGQYVVCLLVGMRLRELASALIPSLRISALCAVATMTGKLAAAALSIHSSLVLALVAVPPAIIFCWLQAGEVEGMMKRAFSRRWSGIADVAET